jgi:hypothetical protein
MEMFSCPETRKWRLAIVCSCKIRCGWEFGTYRYTETSKWNTNEMFREVRGGGQFGVNVVIGVLDSVQWDSATGSSSV